MYSITVNLIATLLIAASISSRALASVKEVSKRSAALYPEEYFQPGIISPKILPFPVPNSWLPSPRGYPPSPNEVSNIIAAAKQASANVLIAQQQVQAAKESILNQQRLAMEKEANAALLTHKSETAAALQRSEAAAAAQAVVLAQHRLAAAKAAVAHQQRIASAKESEAAAALQSSAQAAAAEIHRTEAEAAKFANIQRNGAAAIAHHVTATKDAIISPLSTGTNHVPNFGLPWNPSPSAALLSPHGPWAATGPAIGGPLYYPSKAAFTVGHLWG